MHGERWHVAVATHDDCTALNQTKCTRAPTKRRCSPTEAVLVGKWLALAGFVEILKAHPPMWMWVILTQANTLCTVEGSRLPWRGCTRRINTCACFEYLTPQISRVKEPTHTVAGPLTGKVMCSDQ